MQDLVGKEVSEEEAAKYLGFSDIFELRRWQTVLGHRVVELEYVLKQSQDEAKRFHWEGKRMQIVLEKVLPLLKTYIDNYFLSIEEINKLILAIGVVCGKEVDWNHILKDWFNV